MNTKEKRQHTPEEFFGTGDEDIRFLILHNDDINSFDYVIETLIQVCSHDMAQAEQCAFITHYKGSCDIKKGTDAYLKPLKNKLVSRGLTATIE